MAEYCVQCADMYGLGGDDFKGLTSKKIWAKGRAAVVLCEGCGLIQVDPKGRCISWDCFERHGKRIIIHYRYKSYEKTVCGYWLSSHENLKTVRRRDKVTCKRCLKFLGE